MPTLAVPLDDTDRRILRLLQENAEAPIADVAAKVRLSYAPCWRRIQRLEQTGVIARRVAVLDPRRIGLDVSVLAAVTLKRHDEATLRRFTEVVGQIDEVVECYAVAGDHDFQLRIVVPDVAAYDHLLKTRLLSLPGAGSINSYFALSCVKYTTKLPL
jgi:Lrp/AsnC family transcriptional regulator